MACLRLTIDWHQEYRRVCHNPEQEQKFQCLKLKFPAFVLNKHGFLTRNSVLPIAPSHVEKDPCENWWDEKLAPDETPPDNVKKKRDLLQESSLEEEEDYLEQDYSLPKITPKSITSENPRTVPESSGKPDPLAQAVDDWQVLTQLYTNMRSNAVAMKMAAAGRYGDAVHLWQSASIEGYAKASYNLGLCYELGKGVRQDLKKVGVGCFGLLT